MFLATVVHTGYPCETVPSSFVNAVREGFTLCPAPWEAVHFPFPVLYVAMPSMIHWVYPSGTGTDPAMLEVQSKYILAVKFLSALVYIVPPAVFGGREFEGESLV